MVGNKLLFLNLYNFSMPLSLGSFWNVGFLVFLIAIVQMVTGVFLSSVVSLGTMYLESSMNAHKEVYFGWLVVNLHLITPSFLFFLVYIYILKSLMFPVHSILVLGVSGILLFCLFVVWVFTSFNVVGFLSLLFKLFYVLTSDNLDFMYGISNHPSELAGVLFFFYLGLFIFLFYLWCKGKLSKKFVQFWDWVTGSYEKDMVQDTASSLVVGMIAAIIYFSMAVVAYFNLYWFFLLMFSVFLLWVVMVMLSWLVEGLMYLLSGVLSLLKVLWYYLVEFFSLVSSTTLLDLVEGFKSIPSFFCMVMSKVWYPFGSVFSGLFSAFKASVYFFCWGVEEAWSQFGSFLIWVYDYLPEWEMSCAMLGGIIVIGAVGSAIYFLYHTKFFGDFLFYVTVLVVLLVFFLFLKLLGWGCSYIKSVFIDKWVDSLYWKLYHMIQKFVWSVWAIIDPVVLWWKSKVLWLKNKGLWLKSKMSEFIYSATFEIVFQAKQWGLWVLWVYIMIYMGLLLKLVLFWDLLVRCVKAFFSFVCFLFSCMKKLFMFMKNLLMFIKSAVLFVSNFLMFVKDMLVAMKNAMMFVLSLMKKFLVFLFEMMKKLLGVLLSVMKWLLMSLYSVMKYIIIKIDKYFSDRL